MHPSLDRCVGGEGVVTVCLTDRQIVREPSGVLAGAYRGSGIGMRAQVVELVEAGRAEIRRIDEVRAGADRPVRDDLVEVQTPRRAEVRGVAAAGRLVDDALRALSIHDRRDE